MRVGSSSVVALLLAAWVGSSPPLVASDGRLEINQACAAVGCFAGDIPGFPVQITLLGSYLLTSSLTPPPDTTAIHISSSWVTLDLNGFLLQSDGSGTAHGIRVGGSYAEIRNGTIDRFGGSGIHRDFGDVQRVSKVRATRNGQYGIRLDSGIEFVIEDSVADENGQDGVQVGANSVVVGCKARDNGGDGFDVVGGLVSDSLALFNGANGFAVGTGVVRGNLARGNTGFGFQLGSEVLVVANAARDNTGGDFDSCLTCILVDNLPPPAPPPP